MVQDLKEEVLAYERLMLHVFGFNLYVDLPDFPSALKKVQGPSRPPATPSMTCLCLSVCQSVWIDDWLARPPARLVTHHRSNQTIHHTTAVAYPQGESKPGGPREEEYKKIVAFTINTLNDMYVLARPHAMPDHASRPKFTPHLPTGTCSRRSPFAARCRC